MSPLPPWVRRQDAQEPPLPGQAALVLAGLVIGFVLLGVQLWLLTVALDLLLAGAGRTVWQLAVASGGIFAGGLAMRALLARRPHVHRLTTDESGRVIRRIDHGP